MSEILDKAFKEVDQQIMALTAIRNAMKAAGFIPITTPFSSNSHGTPMPLVGTKRRKRARKAYLKTGLTSRLLEVIADARQPLTTKALYERLVETGWTFNPKAASPGPSLVAASLANLAKTGRITRVGTEWTRV